MEVIYYTIISIGLYFVSDWLLDRIEVMYGKRFQYRSFIFFAIIATLAFATAQLISLFIEQ